MFILKIISANLCGFLSQEIVSLFTQVLGGHFDRVFMIILMDFLKVISTNFTQLLRFVSRLIISLFPQFIGGYFGRDLRIILMFFLKVFSTNFTKFMHLFNSKLSTYLRRFFGFVSAGFRRLF